MSLIFDPSNDTVNSHYYSYERGAKSFFLFKILEAPSNSRSQNGNKRFRAEKSQILGAVVKKFSHHDDVALGICSPLSYTASSVQNVNGRTVKAHERKPLWPN